MVLSRPATNQDSQQIIEFIDTVYREYGDKIFLEGADQDLLRIEASYKDKGGDFRVLEIGGEMVGTHAVLPIHAQSGLVTFRRLYLRQDLRGSKWGADLMNWAINWAKENGFTKIEFWSDTRFHRAHRFFAKFGFIKGERQHMTDGAMPYSEYRFHLNLTPLRK